MSVVLFTIMTPLPQFIYLMQHENAKAAMENYVHLLQQAFEHYRNLWEDYIKLQEKYERSNIHPSSQVKTDEPCPKKKKLTLRRDINDCISVQKNDTVPLLELDTLNMSSTDFNPDTCIGASNSNESQFKDNDNNLPKSPVFSRSRLRINSTSAKKSLDLLSKTIKHNKQTLDTRHHHNVETISQKRDNKLDISTAHHVETTFLPDGKKLKQSRLVFHPTKHEQKISPLNVKSVDTSIGVKADLAKDISTTKTSITMGNNILKINETLEDVIEISPTQRNIKSKVKHYLKLKRKAPVKQIKKNSPAKNKCHNITPILAIEEIDFVSPSKHIPVVMEEDTAVIADSITTSVLKDKTNMIDSSPIKLFDKMNIQITKSIEAQEEKQSLINKPQNITLNVKNPVYEDETFYLPAEQAANKSDANDFNLNDTEIEPPAKKILSDKFNAVPKCKDVPEQFNMRCRADRAKLNGWDCWECKQYYENLPLSKEELQKRKNQCSRHRHKYERPRTPEGFWDLDFPETISSTYQNKN